jgi:thioredoxin-related protein
MVLKTFLSAAIRAAVLALIGIMVLSGAVVSRAVETNWKTNFAQAQSLAAEQKHYLLLDFTGSDWCPWCVKMDKEVFAHRAFMDFAAKNLVLVKLDFPRSKPQPAAEKAQNQELAQKFRIEGYPTYVLLDPNGNEVRRQVGYLEGGPSGFIRWTRLQGTSGGKN